MSNTTGDNVRDGFEIQRLAMNYCKAYSIAYTDEHYTDVINAFCVAYGLGAESKSAKASAVSVPRELYDSISYCIARGFPIAQRLQDKFLSAGDTINNQTRTGAGE